MRRLGLGVGLMLAASPAAAFNWGGLQGHHRGMGGASSSASSASSAAASASSGAGTPAATGASASASASAAAGAIGGTSWHLPVSGGGKGWSGRPSGSTGTGWSGGSWNGRHGSAPYMPSAGGGGWGPPHSHGGGAPSTGSGGSTPVPEPGDLILFAAGVGGLLIGRRSSRTKSAI